MQNLFIINPSAGKGKKLKQTINLIEESCNERKEQFEIYITKSKDDATYYLRKYLSKTPCENVFACGGDGTLFEVINGVYGHKEVNVGVIPLGSGNDFVRGFANKESFLNVKNQLSGKTEKIDLISCNGKLALSQCSIGFDAAVCAKQKQIKKAPFVSGEAAFIISALLSFKNKYYSELEITADDEKIYKDNYVLCVGANSKWYGGGFLASPHSDIKDGFIDLVMAKKPNKGRKELIKLLPLYKQGKHLDNESFEIIRCKKATIKAKEKQFINIDGECFSSDMLSFEVLPKAVSFIVPSGCELI